MKEARTIQTQLLPRSLRRIWSTSRRASVAFAVVPEKIAIQIVSLTSGKFKPSNVSFISVRVCLSAGPGNNPVLRCAKGTFVCTR